MKPFKVKHKNFSTNKLLIEALQAWTHPMLSKCGDNRAYMKVVFNESIMNWLLDGGAQVSCLKTKFFNMYKNRDDIVFKPSKRLISANSGEFQAVMEATLNLTILDRQIKHTIYICPELVSDGIIGVDLMRRLGMILDYNTNVVHGPRNIVARNCDSISLLPNEMQLVKCQIPMLPAFNSDTEIILESLASPDYLINPTLVKGPAHPNDTCHVLMCNLLPTPLNISRHQIIAWGQVASTREAKSVEAIVDRYAVSATMLNEADIDESDGTITHKGVKFDPRTGFVPPHIKKAVEDFKKQNPPPPGPPKVEPPITVTNAKDRFEIISKKLQLDHLDPDSKRALLQLIRQFVDIFSVDKYDLGLTDAFTHKIFLQHDRPIYRKQFRIPDAHRNAIIDHVNNLLRLGGIG